MYYDELNNLFNTIDTRPLETNIQINIKLCENCLTELITILSYPTCSTCGKIYENEMCENYNITRKTKSIYHRKSYFIERLNMICGYKQCKEDNYIKMIKKIKSYEFSSIEELRYIMKRNKYRRYYEHIYNVYFDIKGKRLINLTKSKIENLTHKFIRFEINFKRLINRKNVIPLSYIIYRLLSSIGLPNIEHLNTIKLKKTLKNCKNIYDRCII